MFSTYPDVSSCWQLLTFLLFCRPASFLKDRPHHKSRGNEWPTRAGSLRINWMADDCLYCPSTSKRKLCPFAPLNTQCAAMCRLGFSRPNTIRPKLLADEKTSCLLFVFCLAEANRCCWKNNIGRRSNKPYNITNIGPIWASRGSCKGENIMMEQKKKKKKREAVR